MQEFCPLCAKNGVKSRIKAFQLNFEEAAFLCSSEQCIWPVGCQNLTCINRPVGKDWSKNWDDAATKHIKKEPDPLLELSAYTPPQTPGAELGSKEASVTSTIQGLATTVPNKVFNSRPVSVENFQSAETFEQNGFEDLDIILNSFNNDIISLDDDFENFMILKPKIVTSKTVNCMLGKESTQDPVFIEQCDRTVVLDRNSNQQVNCKNGKITNKTTSLDYKVEVKNEKLSISELSPMKEKPKFVPRLLKRKSGKLSNFEKFDINDLMKQKPKKIKQEQCKKEPIKIEICIPNQTQLKNEVKIEKGNENSQKIIKILKVENPLFDFDLDKMLNETSTKVNSIKNNAELPNCNENVSNFSDKNQIDFDSILGLTSSSKDSGVDQDLADNSGIDMDLEELLAGFSDDLTSSMSYNAHNYNTHKTSVEETDENKWINSLFE